MTTEKIDNVALTTKANVYFDGKCVSHSFTLADGTKKSVGVVLPATLTFTTAAAEIMECVAGGCEYLLAGTDQWRSAGAGQSFDVPVDEDYVIPIGRAKIEREGKDVTIVAFSIMVGKALKAAEMLAEEGIEAEVINLRTIRPLDRYTILESVKKTNRCVTVEEGFPVCSIGNHLSAYIMENAFDYLDAPVINCTGKDVPMPYAAKLEKHALITAPEVVEAVKKVTYR